MPRRRRPTDEQMASLGRAARRNLILERRGPDGRTYLALTSEGWDVVRSR